MSFFTRRRTGARAPFWPSASSSGDRQRPPWLSRRRSTSKSKARSSSSRRTSGPAWTVRAPGPTSTSSGCASWPPGKLNDVWGFKFQTCGNCGTSKQGALGLRRHGAGHRLERPGHPDHRRLRDGRLLGAVPPQDRPHQAPADARQPRRLLRAAVSGPVVLRLQRLRLVAAKFSRDFGAVAWGGFNDDKLRYFIGAFQGREGLTKTVHPFSGATVTSSIEPQNSFEYVGRVHYAFLDAEPGSGYRAATSATSRCSRSARASRTKQAVYKNVRRRVR